ncbi:MAG: choice-of-anchor B family protein [Ignavibacteriae bacterium]|nr:choice-of-anchor B family protein [Ignavibacteriota bacterium]
MFYLKIILTILLCTQVQTFAQATGAVRYLGHFIPPQGGSYVSGAWGWTDGSGREYAILGSYCGTSFVEITDVNNMVERDFVPGVCSSWRELQVHGNYAYNVSEGGGGVQIMDLSYLPDSVHLVKSFYYSQGSKNITRGHTLHIKDGYMYLNGCANWSPGGILIFSLADPLNPAYQGEFAGNYIHDCFVRNDTIYGAAIYGVGVQIINATNKTSPQLLHTISYDDAGTHNTTTTSDGRYVLSTDEIGRTAKTLKIWDMQNPPTFTKVAEYVGSPTAIVHNVFVKDNLAIMSYYTAGVKVVDITNPASPVEVGGYDTYPSNDNANYDGAWSTYPYFPSGKIIVGDMSSGLYVVDVNLNGPKTPESFTAYSDYQTPNSVQLTWNDPTETNSGDPLTNYEMHLYRNTTLIAVVDSGIEHYTDNSLTLHQYYNYTLRAVTAADSSTGAIAGAYAGGHATPNVPSNFNALDATGGALLTWKNPSRQVDGTPLNDLAYILIYRDGVLVDSVAQTSPDSGQTRSHIDSVQGFHSYYIKARDNETPVHYSAATSSVTAYGGILTLLSEDFESSLPYLNKTGTWDSTMDASASGTHSLTDSPGGLYPHSTTSYVEMPPVILGSTGMLQFKTIAIIAFADFGFLEISKNQRQSWTSLRVYNMNLHPEWTDYSADANDWFTERFDLSAYTNDTVIVRFRLVANSSNNADGWYVDDIYIGPTMYETTSNISFNASWNLLSLPLSVEDKSVSTLFPSATSQAFAYEGGYVSADSLEHGTGYWLKFDQTDSVQVTGTMTLKDTIYVNSKWNIIGASGEAIATSKISSIPAGIVSSSYYGFDGSYQAATTLQPGKGYWVKTSNSGKLVLSAFAKSSNSEEVVQKTISQLNTLTLKDNFNHKQVLYFGNKELSLVPIEYFELPPVPPVGAFDVRFTSQQFVETVQEENKSLPISIQSPEYPLTIEWNIQPMQKGKWMLESEDGQKEMTNVGFSSLQSNKLTLRYAGSNAVSLPTSFALHQNYPNPFNPSTVISYQLPVQGFVTIKVYNTLGEEVATLVDGLQVAGYRFVEWNANGMSSGIYQVRMVAGEFSEVKKIIYVK